MALALLGYRIGIAVSIDAICCAAIGDCSLV